MALKFFWHEKFGGLADHMDVFGTLAVLETIADESCFISAAILPYVIVTQEIITNTFNIYEDRSINYIISRRYNRSLNTYIVNRFT
jgi:hypothetical protein